MKKVKHILTIFIHSLVPQDIYYPKLLHTRLLLSINYYLTVVSVFALIFTGVILYHFSPLAVVGYKNSIVSALASFPKDAKLSITKGFLESNLNKPLFLWVYYKNQPLFVLMAHTKDMIKKSEIPLPFVFLGIDKAQYSYRGSVLVKAYDKSWNVIVTKDRIQSFITYINSVFPSFLFFFYLFLIIIAPLVFFAGSTFFILLFSTIVFLLLRTFIPHIHLKKCIQASMHGTHLPLMIVIFLFALFPSSTNVVMIAAALIFVFTLVATYEMYSKELPHRRGR